MVPAEELGIVRPQEGDHIADPSKDKYNSYPAPLRCLWTIAYAKIYVEEGCCCQAVPLVSLPLMQWVLLMHLIGEDERPDATRITVPRS